jgi:hypothetical protein
MIPSRRSSRRPRVLARARNESTRIGESGGVTYSWEPIPAQLHPLARRSRPVRRVQPPPRHSPAGHADSGSETQDRARIRERCPTRCAVTTSVPEESSSATHRRESYLQRPAQVGALWAQYGAARRSLHLAFLLSLRQQRPRGYCANDADPKPQPLLLFQPLSEAQLAARWAPRPRQPDTRPLLDLADQIR